MEKRFTRELTARENTCMRLVYTSPHLNVISPLRKKETL